MPQPFERHEGVYFEQSVVAISAFSKSGNGFYGFLGSGFIIGPYLAVTAKHVIDGFISEFYEKPFDIQNGHFFVPVKSVFHLNVWQGEEDQLLSRRFLVDLVSISAFSDFAVLRLVPMFRDNRYVWRSYNLAARIPTVGADVTAYGYVVKPFIDVDGEEKFESNRYFSIGKVERIYTLQRDVSSLYFPCFETNARYDGGMSGGPIFSQSRYVIGLISASLILPKSEEFPDKQHYSHAATLWPLLANLIEITVPHIAFYPRVYSVQELAILGYISFLGHEDFVIEYDQKGIQTGMTFVPKFT